MSSTYTQSSTNTFTWTNSRYLASKVAADLMRLHRYYHASHGAPSLEMVQKYHHELVLLQMYNFLDEIDYGFVRSNAWVTALKYKARQGGVLAIDDDPGGVRPAQVPADAHFGSVLVYNHRWMTELAKKKEFLMETPLQRHEGNGYSGEWAQQRAYSSGGRGLLRYGI